MKDPEVSRERLTAIIIMLFTAFVSIVFAFFCYMEMQKEKAARIRAEAAIEQSQDEGERADNYDITALISPPI